MKGSCLKNSDSDANKPLWNGTGIPTTGCTKLATCAWCNGPSTGEKSNGTLGKSEISSHQRILNVIQPATPKTLFNNPPPLPYTFTRLQDKVIFVTGASSGIGQAAVRLFAREGAKVVAAARRVDRLQKLVTELKSSGLEASAVECDVNSEESIEKAVKFVVDTYSGLDGAFNNAALGAVWGSIKDQDVADFDRVMATNLRGVWLCMKHETRIMGPSGKPGSIVNVSSVGGLLGAPGNTIYSTSKFGIEGMTRCAAMEFASQGLRVNAIAPGPTRSEMFDHWLPTEEAKATIAKTTPMNYVAEPDDMARAALFLLSDESRWTTGIVLPCEGGSASGRHAQKDKTNLTGE